MEYFKINSLWKREGWYFDEEGKKAPQKPKRQSFIIGDYACPEFGIINRWRVFEKVDGTNIRIMYENGKVSIGGRTKNAQIPCHLLDYLQGSFTSGIMDQVFDKNEDRYPHMILFGEGYGHKIQSGGNYRSCPGFILFDIWLDGWWLRQDSVNKIALDLNIPTVPDLGLMTETQIVDFVKSKPLSRCSDTPQVMEGVVCRSDPLVLFRNGLPVVWKLKCKEFL